MVHQEIESREADAGQAQSPGEPRPRCTVLCSGLFGVKLQEPGCERAQPAEVRLHFPRARNGYSGG